MSRPPDARAARAEVDARPRAKFAPGERREYLLEHGRHAMATSLLAPGLHHFDVPGAGFIAYRQLWGTTLALADPVCAPSSRDTVIGMFLARHPSAGFVQVGKSLAELLAAEHGFYTTRFGVETVIDLDAWSLRGRSKQALRTASNAAAREGIAVTEGASAAELAEVSHAWMATRRVRARELAFLVRPMHMDALPGTRVFCARRGDEPVGFVVFDPIFDAGRLIGQVPNVSRSSTAFTQGIFYAILAHALERFRDEGLATVNLGLSPLAIRGEPRGRESAALLALLRTLHRHGGRLYDFAGIEFAKSRFRGREQPVFVAHRSVLPILQALALLRLVGIA